MAARIPEYDFLLEEIGKRNARVVCLDAGLGSAMKTERFARSFPKRYYNFGIAEQNMVGVASGLARRGFIPIVHSLSNFLTRRALDQIAVSVAWPHCNVKFIGGSCGLFDGRNGPSHMAQEDMGVMASLPGMMVAEPGDQKQTEELMDMLIEHKGPAYMRLRRHGVPNSISAKGNGGDGTILLQSFTAPSCTLIICGTMLEEGLTASKALMDDAVDHDLINLTVLSPLRIDIIVESAKRSGLVISVENHVAVGGFGDAISRSIGPLGVRHIRMTLPHEFIPAGFPQWQMKYCKLDSESIRKVTLDSLKGVEDA